MASYNRVILIGNLTRDPELRHIPTGTPVTDIGLAVNDRRKTPTGEWVEDVTFIDITFWGRTAEIVCEYTSKGSPLMVEGRLKLDTWETDGQKRSKLKVIGDKIQLLSTARGDGGGGGGGNSYSRSSSAPSPRSAPPPQDSYYDVPPDDDVPF